MASYSLLSTANPKILKGEKLGYVTYILHLAPSILSGYNACPMASIGCAAACLNTAGRGGMFKKGETTNMVQEARIRRTKMFFERRTEFMILLVHDVRKAIAEAKKYGKTPAFRLNGTSDIRWESIPVGGKKNIMQLFKNVQWYDYTKIPNRRNIPPNYHLTFSLSETNIESALDWLKTGGNVAAVFDTLPKTWQGVRVINGDDTDLRFLDPKNVIVGLTAKGRAKKDTSGFVLRAA